MKSLRGILAGLRPAEIPGDFIPPTRSVWAKAHDMSGTARIGSKSTAWTPASPVGVRRYFLIRVRCPTIVGQLPSPALIPQALVEGKPEPAGNYREKEVGKSLELQTQLYSGF